MRSLSDRPSADRDTTFLFRLAAALRLRPFRVEVLGDSMRPTLEPGDWCLATAGGRIKKGDLTCFVGLGAGFHWGAALLRE